MPLTVQREYYTHMKTLIAVQESAIESILALPEQGKRAASYGLSLLNRSPKRVGAIRREFERAVVPLGYATPSEARLVWDDVCDVAKLRHAADGE